jgi:hypothetical protein
MPMYVTGDQYTESVPTRAMVPITWSERYVLMYMLVGFFASGRVRTYPRHHQDS